MIYGIHRINSIDMKFVAFDAKNEKWFEPSETPTPTTNFGQAERILARCPAAWMCEIVKLNISWRKP